MGYTKLFSEILMSTVWREADHVRIVWITMLAASDKDGIVNASVPGLADAARVTIDQCEDAISRLSAPDKYSRTSDFEGRRIEAVDGGWMLLNHAKYRAKMNVDDRREYKRLKAREYRSRQKSRVDNVDNCGQKLTQSTHTEAEADIEAAFDAIPPILTSAKNPLPARAAKKASDGGNGVAGVRVETTRFDRFWDAVHLKTGKQNAKRAFGRAEKSVAKDRGISTADAADLITAAMADFADSPRATPSDHSPIHPATWLNNGCYDDDPDTWANQGPAKIDLFAKVRGTSSGN